MATRNEWLAVARDLGPVLDALRGEGIELDEVREGVDAIERENFDEIVRDYIITVAGMVRR